MSYSNYDNLLDMQYEATEDARLDAIREDRRAVLENMQHWELLNLLHETHKTVETLKGAIEEIANTRQLRFYLLNSGVPLE